MVIALLAPAIGCARNHKSEAAGALILLNHGCIEYGLFDISSSPA
jgi:hypothetical protein